MPVEKQVIILYAGVNGYLDDVAVDKLDDFETSLHTFMEASHPKIGQAIATEKKISPETEEALKKAIEEFKQSHFAG
jgi:F-type H+-transporting ATPase subunit alpha